MLVNCAKVDHRVEFDSEYCYIMTSDRNTCLIKSKAEGTTCPLDASLIIGKPQLCFLSKAVSEVSWLWDHKLAHLNFGYINSLVTEELLQGLLILMYNNDTLFLKYECGKKNQGNPSSGY